MIGDATCVRRSLDRIGRRHDDSFFTNKLLTNELKVPEEYKPLFFDYCDAQNINRELLLKENRFLLLDKLNNCSKEFLIVLTENKKE